MRRRFGAGPLIVFVASAFLVADIALIWVGSQADFGFDFVCCYQQAAARAVTDPSTMYDWSDTYTFRYTPIGALPFIPLVSLGEQAAVWTFLLVKLGVLGVTAAWFSSRWTGTQRIGAALLVMTFPPIVHDLVIGNVSTFTVLAFLAAARWHDPRGGVAIGLLTVLMPKPHLIPVLAYLAVRRPRDFLAAMGTVGGGVVIGIAIFGVDPWLGFIGTLREPLERTFTANVGWSNLLGPAGVVIGFGVGLTVLILGIKLGGPRGYGMSIIAGILAGPYTFIHYLSGTIVAVEPVLQTRPRWLVPFSWLLVVFPLIPVWLTALAGVVRASPPPPAEEGEPQAARRG